MTVETASSGTLLALLNQWSDDKSVHDQARLRLLCHQPHKAPNAYLHRLYPGLRMGEIADIEAIVGQPIPPKLREFYAFANGACLFEQVGVSGLVRDFNRDPLKDDPISIEQDNYAFAALHPDWFGQGYFRIGGVSFIRQDELVCGPDDRVIVLHGATGRPLRHYPSIFDCLATFVREMTPFWTGDGVFAGDWQVVDDLLLGAQGVA